MLGSCLINCFFCRWIDRDKCEPVATYVQKWLDLGISWVGGCCRTYAADVGRIGIEVEKWLNDQKKNNRKDTNGFLATDSTCCECQYNI